MLTKSVVKLWRWFSAQQSNAILDDKILFAAILLLAFGVIMVYSASVAYASAAGHSQYYFLIRHVAYIIAALIAFIMTFTIPTSQLQKYANIIALIVIVLLVAVLIPHIGKVVNGSKRWLGIGLLNLQPSELAKLGISIYLANYVSTRELKNLQQSLKDIIIVALAIVSVDLLLLLEPDMGSATVVFIIALSILYLAGINGRLIISLTLGGVIAFVALIIVAPYRMRRVLGFIDPWQDALGKGYQLTHSLLAFGHGGWFGVGIGNSIEKLFYLPEAHTDFILAIIGEETGVLGVLVILLLFWLIFYRGFVIIAREAERLGNRRFQALLAQAISVWFFAQALVNIGVTIGILPTKGLTLPFVSFGGSSILVSCVALAILLKIDYENRRIKCGFFIA